MNKNLDVQGILTEAQSDIECVVMAARQLPPDEGGPIAAMAGYWPVLRPSGRF